jgi:hypothetical protein
MRRSSWTPSIVPTDNDETVYLVADDFGRLGRAWREADYYEANDLETVIQRPVDRPIWQPDPHRRLQPNAGRKMFPKTSPRNCAVAAICRCASFRLRFLISSKGTRTSIGVS